MFVLFHHCLYIFIFYSKISRIFWNKVHSCWLHGRPVIIREHNQMLQPSGLRELCMSYTCMCIIASKKSAISSLLRGGSLDFHTLWHLAVNRKRSLQQTIYKHNLQLSWTSSFWGLQVCPLRQNVGFDVLFTYHEVNVCISFSFKAIV